MSLVPLKCAGPNSALITLMSPALGYVLRYMVAAAVIAISSCPAAARESLHRMPLDELIAIAAGQTAVQIDRSELIYPYNAIHTLGYRPAASPEEEAKIGTALVALLSAKELSSRNKAAESLGLRGRVDYLPQIFALLETEPYLFSAFFSGLRLYPIQPRTADRLMPPVDILRAGLAAANPKARGCVLHVIGKYRAYALRTDVERLLEEDPSEDVRKGAGFILRTIGTTESAPALERAIAKDGNAGAFYALGAFGSDAQVPALLALINSEHGPAALNTLSEIDVTDPTPLIEAFLKVLQAEPERPSLSAAAGLARYRDARALPFLRRLVETQPPNHGHDQILVRAIANVGGPDAISLLNEMVGPPWQKRVSSRNPSRGRLEIVLEELGDPSSGRAVWAAYLERPARMTNGGWCSVAVGYLAALPVLRACADAELLKSIRARAAETTESTERWILSQLLAEIESRLVTKKGSPPSGKDVRRTRKKTHLRPKDRASADASSR